MRETPLHRRRLGRWVITLVAIITGLAYVAVPAAAETQPVEATLAADWSLPGPGVVLNETGHPGEDVYIVLHQAPSLAQYRGEVQGLAATSPDATGATRLDASSAASQAYLAYLAGQHDGLVTAIEAELGRGVEVVHRYDAVLNGVAVRMDAAEAARVASLTGVRQVERDSTRELLTDAGPDWIGADSIHDGTAAPGGAGTMGEGVVVGIIDTGINTDHPSFADIGPVDGYDHDNPRLTYLGVCDPITGLPFCNDKLIGVYDFTQTTPEDGIGHGSHVASTVAGNFVTAEMVGPTITVSRPISGVAPHANIISYKACQELTGNCLLSGILGAINAATLDGVDVINYSIGGGSSNPWVDSDSQAFFDAYSAGIFVATSAGNSGPNPGTLGSPADAPWVTSVGASTHNRQLANGLIDMTGGTTAAPADIGGKGITAGYGPARIVYAGDYAAQSNDPANAHLCGSGTGNPSTGEGSGGRPWPAGTFNGEIVVCDRGEYGRVHKGENVAFAGAGGYILVNDAANGNSTVADAHALPGVHISFADGQVLKAWLADGASDHTGTIRGMNADLNPANGDKMAGFSSRGANPAVPSMIKPDVTAPGVDVLAAYHTPAGTLPGSPAEYNIISGTSMSSPHTAGSGALIRAAYPDWSPDEVKSALMTPAFTTLPGTGSEVHEVLKHDGVTPADPFDMGAGRVDLRQSALVGFVLDETAANHQGADPGAGGDPTTLNVASLGDADCAGTCTWTRTLTGTAPGTVSWSTSTTAPAGISLTVSPASFDLAEGATQAVTITAEILDDTLPQAWTFGEVQFTNSTAGVPDAHFPVALIPKSGNTTPTVVLYMHGNVHEGCTGDGRADLVAGCDPFLSTDPALDPAAPPAKWGPLEPAVNGTAAQNIHDPNWIWNLTDKTTLFGPMTVEWWAGGPGANPVFNEDFTIRLYADGVLHKAERVSHNIQTPNVAQLLRSTIQIPEVTAFDSFVLQIDPVFIDTQQGSFIYYDSVAPCPGASGRCDSRVAMPVRTDPLPPEAFDDNVFVTQGSTTVIDVLANDFDPEGGPLAVEILAGPTNGTAEVTLNNEISYTHDGSATASDQIHYQITDNQGLTDDAFVNITVQTGCFTPAPEFFDDFESGAPGWVVDTAVLIGPGTDTWVLESPDPAAQSPSTSWFTDARAQDATQAEDTAKDVRLVSPEVTVSATSALTFWHRFDTEANFDGGVLEITTDGGATWQDVVAAGGTFTTGGYNSVLSSAASGFVLGGRAGWSGTSASYPLAMDPVTVKLAALAGQTIQVRWRFGQDVLLGHPGGWWVDDVRFSNLITPCPEPPDAVDDTAMVDVGGSVNIDVKANDSDPDTPVADLTVEIVTDPGSGTAVVEADGTVTYTHNGDSATSDFFEYKLSDPEGGFDTARVDITINRGVGVPDAADDSAMVERGQSVTIDVKANDSDPDNTTDELTVTIETQPAHGTAGVIDGQVVYTHDGSDTTSDSFRYRLTDPDGNFDVATVFVTVKQDDGGDKVTGGGYLLPTDGKKINFGFNAKAKADGFSGHLSLNDKSAGVKVKLDTVDSLGDVEPGCGELASGPDAAQFTGTGTYNGEAASFRVCVADLGEPGNSGSGGADLFYLECTSGCSYTTGERTADDVIDGGNIQVHKAKAAEAGGEGGAATSPADGAQSAAGAGVLILDPLLLTESTLPAEVLTVTAYDAAGELATGVAVTLESVGPDGVSATLDGVTDTAGVAVFTVTVLGGDVEHIARSGDLTSNAVEISGML